MTFVPKEQQDEFKRMTTQDFAVYVGLTVGQVKYWASKNALHKTAEHVLQTHVDNANARWQRRVACAVDAKGLKHALARPQKFDKLKSSSRARRMRCGKKFTPVKIVPLDFVECFKCQESLATRLT